MAHPEDRREPGEDHEAEEAAYDEADEQSVESFPASDAPSSWAGPDEDGGDA